MIIRTFLRMIYEEQETPMLLQMGRLYGNGPVWLQAALLLMPGMEIRGMPIIYFTGMLILS